MSSTLSFARLEAPPLFTEADPRVRVLARPNGALVYLPGASSRGVFVEHDRKARRMSLRLFAFASAADYDLAFKLAETLAIYGEVEVDGAGAMPRSDLRARLGDWQVRDRAMALASVRASLPDGPVTVTGPRGALELRTNADADTAEARLVDLAAVEDGAFAMVIAGGHVRMFAGDVLACLASPPGEAFAALVRMRPLQAWPAAPSGSLLLDRDRKTLFVHGSGTPGWDGWTIHLVERIDHYDRYLGEHELGVPRVREPDGDPQIEAVVASIPPGAYEHGLVLRDREWDQVAPTTRRSVAARLLVLVLVLVLLVLLPIRLLVLPFRGIARRARQRRREGYREPMKANLLKVAAATTLDERIDRAIYLQSLGYSDEADLELTRCLATGHKRALVLHNRGTVRHRRLPKLAAADLAAAKEAGYVAKRTRPQIHDLLHIFLGL